MKTKTKIALISLYSTDAIGLRYIKALLKKNGFHVTLILFKELFLSSDMMSLPTEKEYQLLQDILEDLNPDFVGISLRSSYYTIAVDITEKIQKELSLPVIWGGTHPTIAPEESINAADIICIGEGELPLLELAEKFSNSEDYTDIQNMWFRKDGHIIKNDVRPLIEDLDTLPFPDYGDANSYYIEHDDIIANDPGVKTYNLNIMASRGCPYHCSYCCNSVFHTLYSGKGPQVRRRSVGNVMEEIHALKDTFPNMKRIDFIDEVFAWDKNWTSAFTERYNKEVNVPFHCAQHPNMVDKDILTLLKNAGLERVEVGVQSGSERIRKEFFERPVTDKKLLATSQFLKDMGIVPFYDFIVDNPFETEQDRMDGLTFLLKLQRPFHLHVFSLKYFPNTVITKRALSNHLISEEQIEGSPQHPFSPMFVTLQHPRPKHDLFWISLYSLASKRFIPKFIIRHLSTIKFLKKHPKPLVLLADLSNTFKLALIALRWLTEGKPVFSTIRNTAHRGSSPII